MNGQSNLLTIVGWFLGVLTALVFAIVIWRFFNRLFSKPKDGDVLKSKGDVDPKLPSKQIPIIETDELGLNNLKTHVAESILERHEVAADVMKTALDNIFHDEREEIAVSENESEFDGLLGDLTKLSE